MAKIKASNARSTKLSTSVAGMHKITVGRIQKKKKMNLLKISTEKLNEIKSHDSAHTENNMSITSYSLNGRTSSEERVSKKSANKSKNTALNLINKNGSKQDHEVEKKICKQGKDNGTGAMHATHKRKQDYRAHDNAVKFKKLQRNKILDIKQKSSGVIHDVNISDAKKISETDGQVSILNAGAAKSCRWQSLQIAQETLQKKKTLKGTNAKQIGIVYNGITNDDNALNDSDSDSDENNTKQDDEACKSYVNDFGFDACEEEDLSDENEEEDKEEERRLEDAASKKKKLKRDTDELQRTVQVLNVNVKTPKKALLAIFKKYGKVESIRYRNVPVKDETAFKINQIMKRSLDTGRSSMTAFIKYVNPEGAADALQANTMEVQGHHLLVSPSISKTPEQRKDDLKHGCTVMVGNLPYNAEEEHLYRLLTKCGPVVSVNIVRQGLKCSGSAFVAFEHREAAAKAVQLIEPKCQGRLLRVVKAVRKVKKKKHGSGRLDKQPSQGVGKQSGGPRPFVPKGRSRQFAYNKRGTGPPFGRPRNSDGGATEKQSRVFGTQRKQRQKHTTGSSDKVTVKRPHHVTGHTSALHQQLKKHTTVSSDKVTLKRPHHVTGHTSALHQQLKKHTTGSNKSPERRRVPQSSGRKCSTSGGRAGNAAGFGGQHRDQAQKLSKKKRRWTKDEVKKSQLAKKLLTKAV